MKKYISGLLGSLLLLTACVDDIVWQQPPVDEQGKVKVTFAVDIPAYTVATRATIADENQIGSLWLLVFDEKGNYLYKRQASPVTPASTNPVSANGTFSVELGATAEKRIIHFIANYNFAGAEFADDLLKQKDEREIVASLNGTGLYMWARMEFTGLGATTFQSQTVNLLRSMAKITVVLDPAGGANVSNFTDGTFAVRRMPTKGTVAPFNPGTYAFTEHSVTEPAGVGYTASSASFRPLGENKPSTEYTFERRNALADNDYTCIILKGNYREGSNTPMETYYKIDLLDADKNRYNIERNYWYKITIRQVLRPGYATEQQAMDNAAANNTSLDVTIERYPIITDGVRKLEVEKPLITFSVNGSTLDTWTKYYPNVQTNPGGVDNTGVTLTLIEDDPDRPLVTNGVVNFDGATGRITAGINDIPTDGSTLSARIIVNQGSLSRTIRLVGRELFRFDPITINGLDPAVINPVQGSNAELKFTIPSAYPAELFPLEVRIYTQGLYPAQSGLRTMVENGQISYMYTVAAAGVQTIQFKTNLSTSREEVVLRAEGFDDGHVGYNIHKTVGTLSYTYNSVTNPVPYTDHNNVTVTAGRIYMPLNTDGQYEWYYPAGLAPTDQATVSLRKLMPDGATRIFSQNVTIADLQVNPDLNLLHTASVVIGNSITYGSPATNVPQGATVSAVINPASATPVNATVRVLANGQFELDYPMVDANVTPSSTVTFTYNRETATQNTGSVTDVYTQTTTLGEVINTGTIAMATRSNIIVIGNIYYGNSQVPTGQSSNRYEYHINGAYQGAYPMIATGRYRIELPGTTADNASIRFRYHYQGWWSSYYNQTKTLTQLRANTEIRMTRE